VAWLFISAIACIVLAVTNKSLGWLVGSVVLLFVAMYARKQLGMEIEVGRENAYGRFVGIAMLVMLLAMFFLFWLQSRA
jgi:hypothetical protein